MSLAEDVQKGRLREELQQTEYRTIRYLRERVWFPKLAEHFCLQ